MIKLLFQGDSITDCGRDKSSDFEPDRSPGAHLGAGYPLLIASRLLADQPFGRLSVANLGVGGNRIVDLAARAQEHVWNLQPTHLSILIGVNDTWHTFKRRAGVDLARFERVYRNLLIDTRHRVEGVRFILCEPFVLPCGVVTPDWTGDIDRRRAIIQNLATEFDAVFVGFQSVFHAALDRAPAEFWAPDGVHPSPAGHRLMADEWMRQVTLP